MGKVILDTNILIEILKGHIDTIKKVETAGSRLYISSITTMELYYGVLNKSESQKIEKFLKNFVLIYPDDNISRRAVDLIKRYAKSHTLNIPDSIIAATVLVSGYPLMTYNAKDFRYINGIELTR